MPEPILRSLRIDAFRGFNEPVTLDLCASAVVLRGPNGTGKTSVFDALQWLLLGDVERLRALRERRDTEHLVNHYRIPDPASVEAEIAVDGGVAIARRTGNHSGSLLTFQHLGGQILEEDAATEALTAALLPERSGDLGAVLLTSGMMQQDVMRSLLEAKPADRFATLSRLLRLEQLQEFQSAIEGAAERATQRTAGVRDEVHRARRTREGLEQQVNDLREETLKDEAIRSVIVEFNAVVDQVAPSIRLSGVRPATAQVASQLAREAGALRRRMAELALELAQLDASAGDTATLADDVQLAEQKVARALKESERLTMSVAAIEHRIADLEGATQEFARLASLAIPALGDRCPICLQEIDPGEVETNLLERAQETSALIALRSEHENARVGRQQAIEQLAAEEAILLRSHQVQQDATRRAERRKVLAGDLERATQGRLLQVKRDVDVLTTLEVVTGHLQELEVAAERLSAALGSSAAAERLASLESELGSARKTELQHTEALERSAQADVSATTLVKATKAGRVEVAESRYSRVRPLVRDLFARLDAHRAFTELDLEPTVYGRAGTTVMATTRDPERDITANPALVYSSAQANVAALAYFIALSWGAQDHALPFLMLDDPFQSMDDVNVLAFADLSRFLRGRRQLFLSTHERRFADLLERKLAPREDGQRTVVLDFSAWDRDGPQVSQRDLPRARPDIANIFLRERGGGAPARR